MRYGSESRSHELQVPTVTWRHFSPTLRPFCLPYTFSVSQLASNFPNYIFDLVLEHIVQDCAVFQPPHLLR